MSLIFGDKLLFSSSFPLSPSSKIVPLPHSKSSSSPSSSSYIMTKKEKKVSRDREKALSSVFPYRPNKLYTSHSHSLPIFSLPPITPMPLPLPSSSSSSLALHFSAAQVRRAIEELLPSEIKTIKTYLQLNNKGTLKSIFTIFNILIY